MGAVPSKGCFNQEAVDVSNIKDGVRYFRGFLFFYLSPQTSVLFADLLPLQTRLTAKGWGRSHTVRRLRLSPTMQTHPCYHYFIPIHW